MALSEWAEGLSQEVLGRLGARISPATGLRIPPSYATIRRAAMAVDATAFDLVITAWAAEQADAKAMKAKTPPSAPPSDGSDDEPDGGGSSADLVGVAVDGKALRGARRTDGTRVQLLAALRHDTGTVVGQRNVDNDKTNEILALAPLLGPIELTGRVVTADAMHTQKKAARFVVEGKGAHYLLGVKENQPTLWNAAVTASERIDLDAPEHETVQRAHGRIDRHRIWTAPVPPTGFPHARTYLVLERESSTLDDERTSIETRFYVTDLTPADARPRHLLRLVTGHWSIENGLHWVRDVTFDEDRSQVRTATLPRVLATLRNLAISAIRIAADRTVNIAAATRQLAQRARTNPRLARRAPATLQLTVRPTYRAFMSE